MRVGSEVCGSPEGTLNENCCSLSSELSRSSSTTLSDDRRDKSLGVDRDGVERAEKLTGAAGSGTGSGTGSAAADCRGTGTAPADARLGCCCCTAMMSSMAASTPLAEDLFPASASMQCITRSFQAIGLPGYGYGEQQEEE